MLFNPYFKKKNSQIMSEWRMAMEDLLAGTLIGSRACYRCSGKEPL